MSKFYANAEVHCTLYKRKVKGIVGKGYILMYVVIISFGVAKKSKLNQYVISI